MIATVAVVANMPYESVEQLSPRDPGKTGLYPREIRKLLQNATKIKWKFRRTFFLPSLRSLCDSQETLVLSIRQPGNALLQRITRKTQHCIFICDGEVYDPEYIDVVYADDYDRIDYIPATALYPVDPQKLGEIQEENYTRYRTERVWSEIKGG